LGLRGHFVAAVKRVMLSINPELTVVRGAILAVDQFGNLITNLRPSDVPPYSKIVLSRRRKVTAFHKACGEGKPGEIFVVQPIGVVPAWAQISISNFESRIR